MKYLGRGNHDAEFLADLMTAAIDKISAAAGVAIAPTADLPDAVLQDLGQQMLKHAEQIAHAAVVAMTDVFLKTLICAARARGDIQG